MNACHLSDTLLLLFWNEDFMIKIVALAKRSDSSANLLPEPLPTYFGRFIIQKLEKVDGLNQATDSSACS